MESIAAEVVKEFDRVEDREILGAGANAGWRHPLRPAQRKAIPIRLESWYRVPIDDSGGSASWIEAVRSYPPGPDDDGCGLETFFSGWIVREKPGAKPRAQIAARLMYCDRVGANYMLPFGKVRLRQAWFWIYQLSGYDSEWYAVAQCPSRGSRSLPSTSPGAAVERWKEQAKRDMQKSEGFYRTVIRAQSQPSMPLSFTAFTDTTIPAVTPDSVARRRLLLASAEPRACRPDRTQRCTRSRLFRAPASTSPWSCLRCW